MTDEEVPREVAIRGYPFSWRNENGLLLENARCALFARFTKIQRKSQRKPRISKK